MQKRQAEEKKETELQKPWSKWSVGKRREYAAKGFQFIYSGM